MCANYKKPAIDKLAEKFLGLVRVDQADGYFSHYTTERGGHYQFDPLENIDDAEQLFENLPSGAVIKYISGEGYEASLGGKSVIGSSICEAIVTLAVFHLSE